MPDREKVIKGLECCCEHIKGMNCDHCPYDEEQIEIGQINQCTSALAYDALALLKEQEAVKQNLMQDAEGIWLTCGACGNKIYHLFAPVVECEKPMKCQKCGKAVKWE